MRRFHLETEARTSEERNIDKYLHSDVSLRSAEVNRPNRLREVRKPEHTGVRKKDD